MGFKQTRCRQHDGTGFFLLKYSFGYCVLLVRQTFQRQPATQHVQAVV